jgi:pyroglutamyl-peptidase
MLSRPLLLGISSCAALLCTAAIATPAPSGTILVTGFEPFGGGKTNGSWEAVKHLQGQKFGNETVVVAELPVVWGQAGAEPVRIETIAHNVRQHYKDNDQAMPPTDTIAAAGPKTLDTALDAPAIEKSLQAARIPVVISKDAGGYLCNETFYRLEDDPAAQAIPRGFVHVPPLDANVTVGSNKTVFDSKTLAAAADAVVSSVAASLTAAK